MLEQLETTLKETCLISPHWIQLQLQAFWYGLLSWCITCVEDKRPIDLQTMPIQTLLETADPEFGSWPTDWLQPLAKTPSALPPAWPGRRANHPWD